MLPRYLINSKSQSVHYLGSWHVFVMDFKFNIVTYSKEIFDGMAELGFWVYILLFILAFFAGSRIEKTCNSLGKC